MTGEIIAAMREAAPPGLDKLTGEQYAALQELTKELVASRPGAAGEYSRFLSTRGRSLPLPEAELRERLEGKTVLVTGGTGCIGSKLLRLLARYSPARLVSVSRGITYCGQPQDGVLYRTADVADGGALGRIVRDEAPDVVFHVAAQRSPALAEVHVHRTVTTNVLGARNVLAAATRTGAQVVMASTGKAVRPYSPEVYTASKRAAEWIAVTAAGDGLLCSASRFTHVVDNSIFGRLLEGWVLGDEPVRLHDPGIMFYVQSALESAQLLLLAMLGAVPGEFRVNAISDLGWPASLLDLAAGAIGDSSSQSPVYFSGYDPGYEETPFPGLYDPRTAADFSPLLNAFEAPLATSDGVTDTFPLRMGPRAAAQVRFDDLARVCARFPYPQSVRKALDDLSWELLADTVAVADPGAVARSAALAAQYENSMSPVHQRVLGVIKGAGNRA